MSLAETSSSIIVRGSVLRWERSKPKMYCDQLLPSGSHKRIVQSAGAKWERPPTPKKKREPNASKSTVISHVFSKRKCKVQKKEQSSQYPSECRTTPRNDRQMNQVGMKTKKNNIDSSTRLHATLPENPPSRCSPQAPNAGRPVSVTWVSLQSLSSSLLKELSQLHCHQAGKGNEKNSVESKGLIRPFGKKLELDKGLLESKCFLEQEGNDTSLVVLEKLQTVGSAQLNERQQTLQTNNLSDASTTVPKRSGAKKGKSSISKIVTGAPLKSGMVNKKYTFHPKAGPLSTRDQNEVISTWRKGTRMGTKSPSTSPGNSSVITSSMLRDSQSSKVQKVSKSQRRETMEEKNSSKLVERESSEVSLEEETLQKILDQWSKKLTPNNDVFLKDRGSLVLELEREEVQTKIRQLEKVVRDKLEQLQIIHWKKLKARDEEMLLNQRLERILKKIQEIRLSDSFTRVTDKQTQVFASKVPKSTIPK